MGGTLSRTVRRKVYSSVYKTTDIYIYYSDLVHGKFPIKMKYLYNGVSLKLYEEFEDTKEASRIRISKKNRQSNGQKKKYKRTNNDLLNIHIKLKIE